MSEAIPRVEEVGHIHLDAVGGVAGDMFVAGLLDALPCLIARVFADIAAVLPAGCGHPNLNSVMAGGIAARHFALVDNAHAATTDSHVHDQHDHRHGHAHHHGHHHHHHEGLRGTYHDMRGRIEAASLAKGTAKEALMILRLLAEAEAEIHGVAVDDVHFHEVGDWDSLMDVVASGSIVAALPGTTWSVSALPLGDGLVQTAHGLLPVPVPATAKLLAGYSWRNDAIGGERVTPTGAAIIRHVTGGKPCPRRGGVLLGTGSGAGSRLLQGIPNILRVTLFAPGEVEEQDTVRVVECDIDDMTGEELSVAADRLRETEGVRDVVMTQGIGKKGRPVATLRVLAALSAADNVVKALLLETSTLGIRWHEATRRVLPRQARQGTFQAKVAERPDGSVTVKVESDGLAGMATLAARRAAARREEGQ